MLHLLDESRFAQAVPGVSPDAGLHAPRAHAQTACLKTCVDLSWQDVARRTIVESATKGGHPLFIKRK
jgi:hypothetical protein